MSLGGFYAADGRPRTAAVAGGGVQRPITAYNIGVTMGSRKAAAMNFNRAVSANVPQQRNPRLRRYEDIINRLKKMMNIEKQSLRMVRTLCSKEIENRNGMEKVLRMCVDDVKTEIQKKRSENKSVYCNNRVNISDGKGKKGQQELYEARTLTQQEREKIIEVLLS